MDLEKQKKILACMSDVLNDNSFKSEVEQKDDIVFLSAKKQMGKSNLDIVVECCFLSLKTQSEGGCVMQFFVNIFQNTPKENFKNVKKSCDYCNQFAALGYFSFFEPLGKVYLRHHTVIDCSKDLEDIIAFFVDNMILLISTVTRFVDGLASVAFSGMTLDAAIEQQLFP